jgi:hypothetical protein
MRPPVDERAVQVLRANVPEFENHYLDLVDIYDEDLTPQVVFNELADFVTEMVHLDDRDETIERCFAALELVAVEPEVDGTELIAFCFLDQLPPFVLERVRSYMEPVTESIFEQAEQADPDDRDFPYDDGETALLLSDRTSPVRRSAPADN